MSETVERAERGLKVREAAERLGVGQRTVYRMIDSGELQTVLLHKRCRRVTASSVNRCLRAQRGGGGKY